MAIDILAIFCIAVFIFLILLFILSLLRAAAPLNKQEQVEEDNEQLKALGYLKSKDIINKTITSGSPVIKE